MPITGNATYIPTMDEFLAHWEQCNAALGLNPLVVVVPKVPPVTEAGFTALRQALLDVQQSVQAALNAQQIARTDIQLKKEALLARLSEFSGLLSAYFQGTVYIDARPYLPGIGEGQDRFCQPMMDAMSLWSSINSGPAVPGVNLPLVLSDGHTLAQFTLGLSELQEAYRQERKTTQDVVLTRGTRNRQQDAIYDVLKSYRQAVPPRLVQHPVLVETLPRLTPLPGHTPEPVQASGTFVAPDTSKVVYTASAEPTLLRYELEGCNGGEFIEDDAVLVAVHTPADPLEFVVQFGLTQPGTAAAYKVFVVLTTGNRAGSAVVVVQRPA